LEVSPVELAKLFSIGPPAAIGGNHVHVRVGEISINAILCSVANLGGRFEPAPDLGNAPE
jgi:hypothetical protein